MATARRDEIERTLAERVRRRVAGRGVSRQAVDVAVARVLDTLPASTLESGHAAPSGIPATRPAPAGAETIVVAVTARSVPDLGSRLRTALQRDGIEPGQIGLAAAGSHNVATVRIPLSARDAASRAAATLGCEMTVVAGGGA